MELSKMLTLSTVHMSKRTADNLDNLISNYKNEYGWIIPVDDDKEYLLEFLEQAPKDLCNIMLFALDNKCNWIHLDSDGEMISGLPTYKW